MNNSGRSLSRAEWTRNAKKSFLAVWQFFSLQILESGTVVQLVYRKKWYSQTTVILDMDFV